jgi:hypothetical protein
MSPRTAASIPHEVDIRYDKTTNKLSCHPELLQPHRPNHVRKGDTVTFTCDDVDHWAVVFGPEAPFKPQVLGTSGASKAQVDANRRIDRHRHKYVVIAWADGKLVWHDPEVDVDED